MARILVCGGRDYDGDIEVAMETFHERFPISILIHGDARGADSRAASWAKEKGVHVAAVRALWDFYGKSAGFKRNSAMLLLQPEFCIAFPGGKGTQMMIDLCKRNDMKVWRPYKKEEPMVKFLIRYEDPETEELVEVEKEFQATDELSAKKWAEDWAYTAADKGWYEIEEIK